MDKEVLVKEKIDESIKLLVSDCINVCFAVWMYYEDIEDWRLLLASKAFEKQNKKNKTIEFKKDIHHIYKDLRNCISKNNLKLNLHDIKIIKTDDVLVKVFSSLIQIDGISVIDFKSNTINGIYIHHAILLKLSC